MVFFAEMNYYSFESIRGLLDINDFYYFFRVIERVIDHDKRSTRVYIFWSKNLIKLSEKLILLREKFPDGLFVCNFKEDSFPSPTPDKDPNRDLPF